MDFNVKPTKAYNYSRPHRRFVAKVNVCVLGVSTYTYLVCEGLRDAPRVGFDHARGRHNQNTVLV